MRRIIHNTTAIAACLSLLAPHVATAQANVMAEQAAKAAQANAQAEADALAAELCVDGELKEGADTQGLEITCPPVEKTEAEVQEAPEAQAGADTQTEAEVQTETEAQAETEASAGTNAATDAAAAASSDENPMLKPLNDAATQEAATDTAPAAGKNKGDGSKKAARKAKAEAEAAAAAQENTEAAADAVAPGEAEATAETTAAPANPVNSESDPMQQAVEAANAANAEANAVPEANVAETEAAQEAAAGGAAPTAAALDDNASSDVEVIEEQVTEANSRSSNEDFETNLRDALNAATGQQANNAEAAAPSSNNDSDNLRNALILGAGALAVGALLNNNRQVALSTPDRVVVTRSDGSQQVIKDETALLRQPGSTVTTENFSDGSTRTIVTREDGSRIVTIRDADLRVLRRTLVEEDGTTTQLIDDTATAEPVDVTRLPAPARVSPVAVDATDEAALRQALMREQSFDRRFTLAQVRDIPQVRSLVAPIEIEAITFDTGSAAIQPDQAQELSTLGNVIRDAIYRNPREIFLIEGHTDTVGSDPMNLALSDRRAESVALALAEYFDVPPENMVVQGYGEQFLKVRQEGDIRQNRRAAVRRITELLRTAQN